MEVFITHGHYSGYWYIMTHSVGYVCIVCAYVVKLIFISLLCLKGVAILNTEGALVFSPMSFLPRSAMANLTAYILGRSFNILEVAK